MAEIRNPEECWVAVETFRYAYGGQQTFVSSRMVREQAESIREADNMTTFMGLDAGEVWRIQCYVRMATPHEMQEISYNERRMISRLSG